MALVVVPAAALLVWLAYGREDLPRGRRAVLAALRLATVIAAFLLLCGPYLERRDTRKVSSHLALLIDSSASMSVSDEVDPKSARALSEATGVPEADLGRTSRLELARRALLRGDADSPLERLRRKFVLHVYSFSGEPRTLWSGDELREGTSGAGPREPLESLRPDGTSTRLGDCTIAAVEDFRLRDEPLAGVVVVSDGRQTSGGTRTPREAGEYARGFLQRGSVAERGVPVIAVVAGDPSSSRNVQVRNLVAPEVVLARDDASFEFDVVEKGFDGESGVLRLMFVEPKGENVTLVPGDVTLVPGEAGVRVKARHRFDRPGTYRIRIGVPPLRGERVTEDNWVEHQVRVVDRKVKVLYVDGRPRREWESLQRALTRDSETMLVHTLQLESAKDVPQPKTDAPGWPSLPESRFPATRAELFNYDVVVLGDADWHGFADTPEEREQRLQDLRDFVESGGGLLLIAGEYFMPLEYRRTPLAEVFPVIVDPDEVIRTQHRADEKAFNVALTPEGRESPLFRIDDDAARSRELWEKMARWRQWWYFPARRPAAGARVLAVHPAGALEIARNEPGDHSNRYGPHVLAATKAFGLGRTLWLGMDELWRMRYGVGDQYYYSFYAKAIRYLAAYRMLGGNRRVKVHPERQVYYLDEPVGIVAHAVGEDFRPPSPSEKPRVAAVVVWPDRSEHPLDLLPAAQAEGEAPLGAYRGSFTPAVPGTYSVGPDPSEVPGEEPEQKSFVVESSAEEQKDPSVDEDALASMAAASAPGGTRLFLSEVSKIPDLLKSRDLLIPVEASADPLSNQWWIPVALTVLLALEWLLRKRWRLL
jgi:hypothetical protein